MVLKLSGSKTYEPEKFEIILDGIDNGSNIILLKGCPLTAPPVLLSGRIKLSINRPLHIRGFSIRLLGKIRLNIPIKDIYDDNDEETIKFIRFERYFFQYIWNKLIFNSNKSESDCGSNSHYESTTTSFSNDGNSEIIDTTKHESKKSKIAKTYFSKLINLNGTRKKTIYILEPGDHEFYFSTILKGDMAESVHGHPNMFVAYQIVATIQQVGGLQDLTTSKQIRFVRTMNTDSIDLSKPEIGEVTLGGALKVTVSIPIRGIAIGSTTPIYCSFKPLVDKLFIEKVNITLVEFSFYVDGKSSAIKERKFVRSKIINPPLILNRNWIENNGKVQEEDIETMMKFTIPANLLKVTQDCSILGKIKIMHYIEVKIFVRKKKHGKLNSLVVDLPVNLYISPFIPLGTQSRNYFKEPSIYYSPPQIENGVSNLDYDEIIFSNNKENKHVHLENKISNSSISREFVPPDYSTYSYDVKLEFQDSSIKNEFPNYQIDHSNNIYKMEKSISNDSIPRHLLFKNDIFMEDMPRPPSYERGSYHNNSGKEINNKKSNESDNVYVERNNISLDSNISNVMFNENLIKNVGEKYSLSNSAHTNLGNML